MQVDWGSVPDWLSGGGALLAVLFAGIAAKAAIRANIHQTRQIQQIEQQEQDRRAERTRAQAALVAAWVVPDGSLLPRIFFRNGSQLPVYAVTVACHSPLGSADHRYPVRGPDAAPVVLSRLTGVLRGVGDAADFRSGEDWAQVLDTGELAIALCFMDSNGRWWVRDRGGTLFGCTDEGAARAHLELSSG